LSLILGFFKNKWLLTNFKQNFLKIYTIHINITLRIKLFFK